MSTIEGFRFSGVELHWLLRVGLRQCPKQESNVKYYKYEICEIVQVLQRRLRYSRPCW